MLRIARKRFLNWLGVIILAAGFAGAALLWRADAEPPRAVSSSSPLEPDDSRRYTHDMELYYGKTGLLVDQWKRALANVPRKTWANLLVGVSLLAAGGCFLAAEMWKPVVEAERASPPAQQRN